MKAKVNKGMVVGALKFIAGVLVVNRFVQPQVNKAINKVKGGA